MSGQKENPDELWARKWLIHQGYNVHDIRRPFDDPPDYIVENCIAVEVTRLNQRYNNIKGVESVEFPLEDCLKDSINILGPPGNEGCSWVIDVEYDPDNPPTRFKKVVKPKIIEALKPLTEAYDEKVKSTLCSKYSDDSHSTTSYDHDLCLYLECGIWLQLVEIQHKPERFILQGISDSQGILLVDEMSKRIDEIIHDKSERVKKRNNMEEYREWWLVLVDHICRIPNLQRHELDQIRNKKYDFWNRVVLINSGEPHWHLDLFSNSIVKTSL
ncbi:MAG: hypothetical protein OXG88_10420 [Gammaproteobacteria bacterium]|nr:hypothetical protein [Gammaproteobacteria bacterium]